MGLTFGTLTAPNNVDTYLDAVFSTSLANMGKKLKDNIGASNGVLYDLLKSSMYQSADGGTYLTEPLLIALATMDSYSGYDEMGTGTVDGITTAIYEWRQMASPISYNFLEATQNMHRIIDLVDTKIQQSEMGIQEGFARAWMWGAAAQGGNLYDPRVSPVNGSYAIDPLPRLVSYDVTSSRLIGGIDQNLRTWWRNHVTTSTATTYKAFMQEWLHMYYLCSNGNGGPVTHILVDQVTFEHFINAYQSEYKKNPEDVSGVYPFVAKKFMNAKVIMDDKVPDYYSNAIGTVVGNAVDPSTLTYGSAIFLNDKFLKVRYLPERDFKLLKDENGKGFVKPINGDSRVGQIGWMGNSTISNRQKHGVIAKIARTLT